MTFVATLGFLAGCSELSDNRIEQSVNKSIQEVNDAVSKTVQTASLEWYDETKRKGVNGTHSLAQPVGSATGIILHNEVGNIDVKAAADDQITVKTTIWASRKSSQEDFQSILDNAVTEVIAEGKQLRIVTRPKDDPKQNLWDWAQDKYGHSELFIEYDVGLPVSVKSYEISSNVGAIHLNQLEGNYKVHNEVGSITIDGARIIGPSSVKSETGSIQLGIDQMDSKSSFNVATEVGSIRADLAATLECNIETATELGQVTGAEVGESERNGGGPKLSLSTSIGAITVN